MPVATIRETMRIVFFVIASTTLMSCLVTDSIDNVQPVNFPSSVVSTPDAVYPLNRIVQLNRDELTEDPEFDVIIRDANVNTQLQTRVLVIRDDGTQIFESQNIILPTANASVERSSTIRVPFGVFVEGCLKIELLVSEFRMGQEPEEDDVHSAVWWVAVTASGGDPIDLRGCLQ